MAQWADKAERARDQVRLPAGAVVKPPVSLDDLKTDIEYDPEGAEEFVVLIRAARKGISQSGSRLPRPRL
jgi:hypothetical protein